MSNLIEIAHEDTNPKYGCAPQNRSVKQLLDYGLIPLDKTEGPTSHEVVAWVRRILNVKKAGHSGTLDPPATGLLPIGLGEATKALSVLLLGSKEYVAVARLHDPVDDGSLKRVIKEFTGEIFQKPPQRSSVKRVTRTRTIYELELLEQQGRLLILRVLCESGTYIRKLVYDMGEVFGCGATMVELRRTRVSNLSEQNRLVRLHDLADAYYEYQKGDESKLKKLILSIEYGMQAIPSVVIRDSAVEAVCNGAKLAIPGILKVSGNIKKGDTVGFYTLKGEIVALAEASMSSDEIRSQQKGIAAEPNRVIMKQGTYPKMWKSKPKEEASN
ncbi:MAG: RNA-guided pseudouridylation complex pseudouridine synthase subunit Cbf5 [Thaumarchaeota archaeon]|nr:RNA-guided pseudouridylation complex pseudouridine synthase subunit Cbf5 [Nitrososphaerota archaeon]